MHIFYQPDIASGVLSEQESLHAVKVLRLQVGNEINIIDGIGGFYQAKIVDAHPKRTAFEIIKAKSEYGKRDYKLHIAIAPTKNIDRFEWFVEKAVEIGVDEITPILCRYSERKRLNLKRTEKIIIAAAKQSQKAYLPVLHSLTRFQDFLKQADTSSKFIAHCYNEDKKELKDLIVKSADVLVMIGPEGDFSAEELKLALEVGYQSVTLGDSRLRTETAGVVVAVLAAMRN